MIGGDNRQARSSWGVQVKQLTKILMHLIAPQSTPEFWGKVCLNLALAWLLPVAVIKLHVGDLHAVGWGGGP